MRLRGLLAYDGTAYRGWQSQGGNGPTIQESVEAALQVVLRHPVRVAAAGRTDTGVHARGQVIAFDASLEPDAGEPASAAPNGALGRVLRSVNAVLAPDIALLDLSRAPEEFDPRRSAVLRCYQYRIWNARPRSPFEQRTAWHVPEPLDAGAMAAAAALLLGEHDFACFQGADHVPRSSVRRVQRSEIERGGAILSYWIEANAFARHMVRNIVGQLVEIGHGRAAPKRVAELLLLRDRRAAAAPAPPEGLFLEWVRYE
jgi:tRNA pseudouridine38-40 synthase